MATAAHVYGWHSTPGIWLALLNLPGFLVAVWVSYLIGENVVSYVVYGLVNWAFYFYLAKGAVLLKRKLSN